MSRCFVVLTFASILINASISFGHNSYFLPGDAFFHTVLTEDVLNQIDKQDSPTFKYNRPDFLGSSLCGYAGFHHLQYVDMPEKMKQHLRKVYRELRELHPKRVEITHEKQLLRRDGEDVQVPTGKQLHTEINGFHVLFYNKDFDRARFRLCLKYNEHWADEVAGFGHDRNHVRLESFVKSPAGVAEEWRDAGLVSALKAVCPPVSKQNIDKPIQVDQSVHALIIPTGDFEKVFSGHQDVWGGLVIYDVSAGGVQRLTSKGPHWAPIDPNRGFGQ